MDSFINHWVRKQYLFVDLNTYSLTDNTGYLVIDWIRFGKKPVFVNGKPYLCLLLWFLAEWEWFRNCFDCVIILALFKYKNVIIHQNVYNVYNGIIDYYISPTFMYELFYC